ncbi:transporter substrate-binding domain-containing protein [Roseivirga sp. E12]|uniref:transporter substrate-binding domain-containing protein n=1 Tax=Roseivirga sp. E12 TaxID=2819237 RepID=UPI001ABCFD4E|nr:transporter substrate-binding domain-containing protein [Roseivirga sp. E12]MBO3699414.1 transporter substrate-binding domain-containing protein [Roseivirga sp. E12]
MSWPKIVSKLRVCLVVLLPCIILFECANKGASESTEEQATIQAAPIYFDLDQIKTRGSLIAVVDNSTTGYFIYRGRPIGYEYELLTRLAKYLKVELEVRITADIQGAFDMLDSGEADIMAYHLTVTKERNRKVAFTEPHNNVPQVLVQRKPKNWRQMKLHEIEASLIRSTIDLGGKTVYTRKGSAFSDRLLNLSDEIGEDIVIDEVEGAVDTEMLIKMVLDGDIEYTIADQDVAMINATYYPDLDVETPISFPQKIAWAVRKNATDLKSIVDDWLVDMKKSPDFFVIYNRYFKNRKSQNYKVQSAYSSFSKDRISPYDDLIKEAAQKLDMDWLLLTSIVFQESKFDPESESWVGAQGLMQLTNNVIEEYEVDDVFDPEENIMAGADHLKWLMEYWSADIADENELIKFVLGSYNVGQGHVRDAMKLAKKYDADPLIWENSVAKYLELKSTPEYYQDPIVVYGYCRGSEPVKYVREILTRYDQYLQFYENPNLVSDTLIVTERIPTN